MFSRFKSLITIVKVTIILSIIAIILSFIPILNTIGIMLGFVGVILGLINIFSKKIKNNSINKMTTLLGILISFFAIVISVFTILLFNPTDDSDNASENESSISSDESSDVDDTDYDDDDSTDNESASESSEEPADPASYETGITYDQLARNPDDNEESKVTFTGKVLQVMEDSTSTQLRMAVDGDYDNVLLLTIDDNDILNGSRVLENDLITIKGISEGTTTYESTMGGDITIPEVSVDIIDNQGPASDDYGY